MGKINYKDRIYGKKSSDKKKGARDAGKKVIAGMLFAAACFVAVFVLLEFHKIYWLVGVTCALLMAAAFFFLDSMYGDKDDFFDELLKNEEEAEKLSKEEQQKADNEFKKKVEDQIASLDRTGRAMFAAMKRSSDAQDEHLKKMQDKIDKVITDQNAGLKTMIKFNKENARQMALSEKATLEEIANKIPTAVNAAQAQNVPEELPDIPFEPYMEVMPPDEKIDMDSDINIERLFGTSGGTDSEESEGETSEIDDFPPFETVEPEELQGSAEQEAAQVDPGINIDELFGANSEEVIDTADVSDTESDEAEQISEETTEEDMAWQAEPADPDAAEPIQPDFEEEVFEGALGNEIKINDTESIVLDPVEEIAEGTEEIIESIDENPVSADEGGNVEETVTENAEANMGELPDIDINALFGESEGTEAVDASESETTAETESIAEPEPTPEHEKITSEEDLMKATGVDLSNPNANLTPEDIAKLFAASGN